MPPFSSAGHSSSVSASHEVEECWRRTVRSSKRAYSTSQKNPGIARCGTSVPFGCPVEPDV